MDNGTLAAAAQDWVESSCATQGLPVKVTDASRLAQVAALLGAPARPAVGSAPSSAGTGVRRAKRE